MKQSKYNFFFPIEKTENYLAFNALKNGLAVFPAPLVQLLESLQPGTHLELPEENLSQLKKGGFICDDHFDEYGLLVVRRHLQQYSSNNSLGLTVAPGLFCNLSCSYCFESPQNIKMDNTVITQLVEMVQKRIETGLKSLSILWYGGEPLLYIDIIEELSQKLIDLCIQKEVKYDAYIITNGTRFTRETAEKLKTLKVNGAQITLDGHKEFHDIRRPLSGWKRFL